MGDFANLEVRLTGGASNTDPTASLGDPYSTVSGGRVWAQTATATDSGSISGVTVNGANGNVLGNGALSYNATDVTLSWAGANSTPKTAVDVSAGGDFALISSSGGVLVVTVDETALPGSGAIVYYTITDDIANVFADVTNVQSDDGITQYRWIVVKNGGSTSMRDVTFWLASQNAGSIAYSIALGTLNTDPDLLADEETAPVDIVGSFAQPSTKATGLVLGTAGVLAAGDYHPIAIKRVVPAGGETKYTDVGMAFGIYVKP